MTRRTAWRTLLGLLLAYPTKVALGAEGVLTIDLTQWKTVRVTFKGQETTVSTAQLFEALR